MSFSWMLTLMLFFSMYSMGCMECDSTQIPELTDGLQPTKTTPSPFKNKKLLKIVEKTFMSLMGVSGKPNRTKDKVHVPDHMWKLYHKWNHANEQEKEKGEVADTARLLHNENEEIPGRLDFNISSIPKEEVVHGAELLIFTESRRGLAPHKHLHLYKPKFINKDRLLAYYKKIRNERKGYVKIDITDLIRDWKVNGVENSSMIVEIDRNADDQNSVHTRRRRNIDDDEWLRKQPLLIVYTMSKTNTRKKTRTRTKRNIQSGSYLKQDLRELNETHQKVQRETCRLRRYLLDFMDFGWDEWIIAPSSYNLNFCSGACPKPLGPHFNTTNHAVIQNAVLGINKKLVPSLCCIPTSFKDQTFLFLDSVGKLLLKTPVEMIALGCGCH